MMTKTTPTCFTLEPKTGALAIRSVAFDCDARGQTRVAYHERFLESLLVLNPALLGVEGHIPLLVHGGQSAADQVYCDDLGRLVAVECKSGVATRTDLIQLLGYGFQLPFDVAATEADTQLLGVDVLMVRPGDDLRKLSNAAFAADREASIAACKAALDESLGKPGEVERLTARTIERLAVANYVPCDDQGRFMMSPRMVLVARGFTEDCVDFCRELNARMIDVALVRVEVFDGPDGRLVVHEVVHAPVALHAVRDAIGHVWRDAETRARFVPEGWYFAEKPSFSFGGTENPNASFWLELDGNQPIVGTRVPHSTFDTKEVGKLNAKLKARLPKGFEKNGSDWEWRGKWTAKEWADAAVKTAQAAFDAFDAKD